MSTWHQDKAIRNNGFVFYHETLWTAYNPKGHTGLMRFATELECITYCKKTGDVPLAPANHNRSN